MDNGIRTWGERLLELVGLVGVEDAEGVEVLGAPNLELDGVLGPLDPHRPRVLPPRRQEEVLDLVDLLRLRQDQNQTKPRGQSHPLFAAGKERRGKEEQTHHGERRCCCCSAAEDGGGGGGGAGWRRRGGEREWNPTCII